MTDPETVEPSPGILGDLPLQPTGSGVADLEIAFEQMKLGQDAKTGEAVPAGGQADDAERIAHPS